MHLKEQDMCQNLNAIEYFINTDRYIIGCGIYGIQKYGKKSLILWQAFHNTKVLYV